MPYLRNHEVERSLSTLSPVADSFFIRDRPRPPRPVVEPLTRFQRIKSSLKEIRLSFSRWITETAEEKKERLRQEEGLRVLNERRAERWQLIDDGQNSLRERMVRSGILFLCQDGYVIRDFEPDGTFVDYQVARRESGTEG